MHALYRQIFFITCNFQEVGPLKQPWRILVNISQASSHHYNFTTKKYNSSMCIFHNSYSGGPYSNGCYALARHLLKLLPKVRPKLTSMLVASQYFGQSAGAYFPHVLLTQTWNFETKCIILFMIYNSTQWPQILLVMLCLWKSWGG